MRLVLPLVAVVSSLLATGCCSTCSNCGLFSCSKKPAMSEVAGAPTVPTKTAVSYKNPTTDPAVQQVGAVQPAGQKAYSVPAKSPSAMSSPTSSLPKSATPALPDGPPSAMISVPPPPSTTTLSQPRASLPTPHQIAAQKTKPSLPALPANGEADWSEASDKGEATASTSSAPAVSNRSNLSWTPSMPPRTASTRSN